VPSTYNNQYLPASRWDEYRFINSFTEKSVCCLLVGSPSGSRIRRCAVVVPVFCDREPDRGSGLHQFTTQQCAIAHQLAQYGYQAKTTFAAGVAPVVVTCDGCEQDFPVNFPEYTVSTVLANVGNLTRS
jgi:hypothetical protein